MTAHRKQLFRYARRLAGNHWRAQDLLQDTFVHALEAAPRFEDSGSEAKLISWLMTIMRNIHFSEYRRRKMHVRAMLDIAPLVHLEDANKAEAELTFDAVRRMLRILPDDQRRALFAVAIAELPYADAARAEGCAEGTIKSRVHRARLALEGCL